MIVHRVGRDFARCARKYGKDWDRVRYYTLPLRCRPGKSLKLFFVVLRDSALHLHSLQ